MSRLVVPLPILRRTDTGTDSADVAVDAIFEISNIS